MLYLFKMKKLVNLIALVMLVSTNVLTPFSYAQEETPEVIPENEVGNVEEIGETLEKDNEITGEIPNSLWEVEWERSLPLVREVVNESEQEGLKEEVEDLLDAVESPITDENKDEDTEKSEIDEVVQPMEENAEIEKQEENLEWDELEEELGLQKIDEPTIMEVKPWTSATLLPWQQFNQTIKRLAWQTSATYSTRNTTIQQIIQWSWDIIPSWVTTTWISTSDSEREIIAWYDDWIIYYYTEAETIYMNPDSSYMFYYMEWLTRLDISNWDTSNVTNMSYMFEYCYDLESLDLKKWDTSNVIYMNAMFNSMKWLTWLDLSNFDTSNVTNMWWMFAWCNKLRETNLSWWNFSKVNDCVWYYGTIWSLYLISDSMKKINLTNAVFSGSLYKAFSAMNNLEEIELNWVDTTNVKDMRYMFEGKKKLRKLNLKDLDTSNVINMNYMFQSCEDLIELDLWWWNVTNLKDYGWMFAWCNNLEYLSLSWWDLRNVDVRNMVNNMRLWNPLKVLDMTNAKFSWSMNNTFEWFTRDWLNTLEKIKLDGVDTTNVVDMSNTFSSLPKKLTELDLRSFDTSSVTNMTYMFGNSEWLKKINFNGWNTKKVEQMTAMFYNCSNLIWLDLSNFDTSNVTNMGQMFYGCSNLIWLDLSNFDTSNVTNMGQMFYGCSNLTWLDLSNFDTSNVINMWFGNGWIFWWCNKLEELNLSWWNFKGISNNQLMMYVMWWTPQSLKKLNMTNTKYTWSASYAFGWLTKLEELNLDWADTRGVTNMNTMFNWDSKLKYLDLSNFDTSNVTNMGGMFSYCSSLTWLDLSSFDTSKVTDMWRMFQDCSSLTWLDLSSWDTSNVNSMIWMFNGCNKLEELNMSWWKFNGSSMIASMTFWRGIPSLKKLDLTNTKYTWSMAQSFRWYTELEEIKLEWADTSNVTDMADMFYGCSNLSEIDLSNWDTRNVTKMDQMFYNTPNLKTIYASNKFVITALSGDNSSDMMFTWTISLIWWNGTKFDPNYIDKTYAKIDKVWQTWYFTDKNAINVKFINTLDWTETTSTFAKWQKLTPPYVDKYHVVWWYLDEEMTQAIDLNKWVDSYSVIYIKYERNGSSGWWGRWWSSKKTDEDTHWSAEDSQKNTQDDKNTENVIQSDPEHSEWGSEESINTPVDSSDKSSEWQEILSPSDLPSSAGQVSFTKEQKDAYIFAKENWITTKDTIQLAQMNGKLTRIAMAKMLSQYAMNVLWQTPDTSKTIKFKDVSNKKDADYDNWVTLAYQLWIMWQNMPWNKFRPNDEVSRAEFATALSRLLYQTTDGEYKSTKEYYIPHMAKLYNEWIISNTDPSMAERRWYVMIMLMRSAK